MTNTAARAQAEARIVLLEEALAEYAMRYGLTERARALFREGALSSRQETRADGPAPA